jgi:carbon storage regulator CsrA
MLVLSRREQEAVVFPKLGIRIEVTRVRGKAVSLGIDAPESIRVLRGEIATEEDETSNGSLAETSAGAASNAAAHQHSGKQPAVDAASRQREHELRNRINTLTIALHLLQKKARRSDGQIDDALLSGAIDELALIEEALQDSHVPADLDQVGKKAGLPLALIVDDNENENALMAGFLRQFGFRVAIAMDGQAALRLIEQSAKLPDIVLLDMNMPGLNGRGTIEAIRHNPKTRNMRVFAVSGEPQETCDVPVGSDGVDRWFRKPIRPDHLVQEMATGLMSTKIVC